MAKRKTTQQAATTSSDTPGDGSAKKPQYHYAADFRVIENGIAVREETIEVDADSTEEAWSLIGDRRGPNYDYTGRIVRSTN